MKKEGGAAGAKKKGGRDASNSLIVMALKRLTPVGMNLFAGREQELVQHVKDRFLQVRASSEGSSKIALKLINLFSSVISVT